MPGRGRKSKNAASIVPFARGFKRPGAADVKKALGIVEEKESAYYLDNPADSFFKPLPQPTSKDDWLAQYNEEGQTYSEFLEQCPWLSSRRRKYLRQEFNKCGRTLSEKYPDGKIYLLPLGSFGDGSHCCRFDHLAEYTSVFFGSSVPVVQLNAVDLELQPSGVYWSGSVTTGEEQETGPPPAKRARRGDGQQTTKQPKHYLPSRQHSGSDGRSHFQLLSDGVLERLRHNVPDDALCLIALTMADLYSAKPDLFVAGYADGRNRVAVS